MCVCGWVNNFVSVIVWLLVRVMLVCVLFSVIMVLCLIVMLCWFSLDICLVFGLKMLLRKKVVVF